VNIRPDGQFLILGRRLSDMGNPRPFTALLGQESGHLINGSSVGGHLVFADAALYCGTKFAVQAISEAFRQEAGPKIRSTFISPGSAESELFSHVTAAQTREAMKAFVGHRNPVRRQRDRLERLLSATVFGVRIWLLPHHHDRHVGLGV
jgi:short-subunit dehydrogenase